MAEVIMPKMSDAMTEGKVLSWRKRVGDRVARGDVLAEIETDKVNVEIEAESAGTLSEIVVGEGTLAPVGAVIARINGGGAGARPAESPSSPPRQEPAPGPPARPARASTAEAPAPSPRADEAAAAPERPAQTTAGAGVTERIKASPLARRLAAERGIDLWRVTGTGPGGRIIERDIEALAAGAPAAPARPATAAPAGAEYEDVGLSRMRQAIARSVAQSHQTIPHFYVTSEVEMRRALDLRTQLKEAYGDAAGALSINDLIVKAAALALRARPDLNATLASPETVRRFRRVHLGIMVAVPDGLVVPVLRDADRLPLLTLATEARRLIEGARERRLRQDDFSGATFSISNLGMYDVTMFSAIINGPQAGILAVGRIQERPVVRDGAIVARPMVALTVSVDHRVTDGVGAAAFLAEVKRLLEHPVLLLGTSAANA
jgi:pyruvate dehydrogenase E2 component (dihydrolipoamide acetyltransferase)